MTNADQADYWNGRGGQHWVAEHDRYDSINGGFSDAVIGALAPQPGEHILDVGCGNGALGLAIAPLVSPGGSVTGLDLSRPMLEVAARRAADAGIDNATFERGDAQIHSLPPERFDGVVSRFGVMFFDDPDAAFANLARALRPGGRLAFVCWQDLLANEWLMVPAGAALAHVPMPDLGPPGRPGPFSLADPDRVRSLLAGAGFAEVDVEEARRPMPMGSSVDDTLEFMRATDFSDVLLADVADDVASAAWDAIRGALEPYAGRDGVVLSGAAWLVTAIRRD
jgi:SAM-dependent methyltransferase